MDNGHVRGHRTELFVTNDIPWQPENTIVLLETIARLERELPGWWWSVGACHVSADASCGPDRYGPDAMLCEHPDFGDGFHADLRQPATIAEALNDVIDQATAARAALQTS